MKTMRTTGLAVAFVLTWAMPTRSDEFGRLEGPDFFNLIRLPDTRTHASLSFQELDALPTILRTERSALVIVKTDQGNLAKMLVSAGLRKLNPSQKDGPSVPVLIIERFATIDAADRRSFTAKGKDVMLFDGFQFDVDAGQVVPGGMGGDIVFKARATRRPAPGGFGRIAFVYAP